MHAFRAQVGVRAQHIAVIGLLDRLVAGRLPFGIVGVDQLGPGHTPHHERELPREVVRILDAGVAAEAAGGGHGVCRIACDEDAALLEHLGCVRHGAPLVPRLQAHFQVRVAHRVAHQLYSRCRRDAIPDVARVAHGEHDQEPPEPGLLQAEEAAHLRVVDVDHPKVATAQGSRAVGAEIDGDAA